MLLVKRIKQLISYYIIKFRRYVFGTVSGKHNVIRKQGYSRKLSIDINGDSNLIQIDKHATIAGIKIFVVGNNNKIIIENNCVMKGGELWIEGDYCQIKIGSGTTIEHAHIAVTEFNSNVIIGQDCMLANNIEIRTGDSHSIIDLQTTKRINNNRDVIIENHVWIGSKVSILKGVKLGANSIIGTGSIVTKDTQPNTISAGNPARVIKSNIDWLRERI